MRVADLQCDRCRRVIRIEEADIRAEALTISQARVGRHVADADQNALLHRLAASHPGLELPECAAAARGLIVIDAGIRENAAAAQDAHRSDSTNRAIEERRRHITERRRPPRRNAERRHALRRYGRARVRGPRREELNERVGGRSGDS